VYCRRLVGALRASFAIFSAITERHSKKNSGAYLLGRAFLILSTIDSLTLLSRSPQRPTDIIKGVNVRPKRWAGGQYMMLHCTPGSPECSALATEEVYVSRDAWIMSAAMNLQTGFTTVDVLITSRGAGTREKWSAE
jgi:hypothetical protein